VSLHAVEFGATREFQDGPAEPFRDRYARRIGGGHVEVSAVDPAASMAAVDNPALGAIAGEVRDRLKKVIDEL